MQVEPKRGNLVDKRAVAEFGESGYALLRVPKHLMQEASYHKVQYSSHQFAEEPVAIGFLLEDMHASIPNAEGKVYAEGFPQIRGTPNWQRYLRSLWDDHTSAGMAANVCSIAPREDKVDNVDCWIIDTGTSFHIADRSLIEDP